ncbi:hypothetical protein [Methylobacterium sp. AMS5]|uniref:hypothetical protein n=1 Tax=Methylobacterium sp. AMS5 TaxID=925818 RepID=UPI00257108CB|nr:hypothetical protein [Methylobacterium sp. AMS5]
MSAEDVGDACFSQHVEAGNILLFRYIDELTGTETRRYCLPTEEWRVKLSILIQSLNSSGSIHSIFSFDDLHRIEGHLLSYDKIDIEHFINIRNMNI